MKKDIHEIPVPEFMALSAFGSGGGKVTSERGKQICCLSLIKVEEFSGMIKGVLGPLMGDLFHKA
jgi:hypothetical protein